MAGSQIHFEKTSRTVTGIRAYVRDRDTVSDPVEPISRRGCPCMAVAGVGWATSRRSRSMRPRSLSAVSSLDAPFERETSFPDNMIAPVSDRITLRCDADATKTPDRRRRGSRTNRS